MKYMKKTFVEKILLIAFLILIPFSINAANPSFMRSLTTGSTGEDVKQLQVFLNNYSPQTKVATTGTGSPGNETLYFGNLTKQAVIKFQNMNFNEILKPVNLSAGTGYFGPSTINFISRNTPSVETVFTPPSTQNPIIRENILSNKPKVFSISPTEGTIGTEIIIKGTGFTSNNDILMSFEPIR